MNNNDIIILALGIVIDIPIAYFLVRYYIAKEDRNPKLVKKYKIPASIGILVFILYTIILFLF